MWDVCARREQQAVFGKLLNWEDTSSWRARQYGTLMQLIGLILLICHPLQKLLVCIGTRWTPSIRVHLCLQDPDKP